MADDGWVATPFTPRQDGAPSGNGGGDGYVQTPGAATRTDPDDPGYGAAIGSGLISGTPFGRLASAGAEAIESYLPKYLRAPGDVPEELEGSLSDRFSKSYESVGKRMRTATAAHPYVSTAASFAPSLVGGGGGGLGRAALTGAGWGASTAINEAETPQEAATDAVIGGVTGGVGGGLLHTLIPGQTASSRAIAEAAKNLDVPLPRYVAATGELPQRMGQLFQSVPFVGGPLRTGTEHAIEKMGTAAGDVSQGITKEAAGAGVKDALGQWIGPISEGEANQVYSAANNAINQNTRTALYTTRSIAGQILKRRSDAGLMDPSGAVDRVANAINDPNGLTYSGIKTLRSDIGELVDRGILPEGMKQSELRSLYSGLTTDLDRAAYNGGGQQGLALHQAANARYEQISQQRQRLATLLGGSEALKSGEGVYAGIQKIASDKSGANIDLLRKVKASTTPQSWEDLGRGMIGQMGRDTTPERNFSPQRFLTDYGGLSDAAKDELFGASQSGSVLRQNLDDLQTLSQQFKKTQRFGNPSGTGHVIGGLGMFAAGEQAWEHRDEIMAHPFTAVGTLLGTAALGKYLSSPAGSGAMTNFVRAHMANWARPSPQTRDYLQQAAQRMAAVGASQFGMKFSPDQLISAMPPGY